MYIKDIMYGIACDGCESFYEDPNGWSLHNTKSEAEDAALSEETRWLKHEDKHYCPNCYLTDDNDNIVLRKNK